MLTYFRANFRKKSFRLALGATAFAALLAVIGVLALRTPLETGISPNVRDQVTFPIFYVASQNPHILPRQETVKYDTSTKLLTYLAQVKGTSTLMTISEQALPPEFSESPETYKRLLQKLNEYASYDSRHGTLHLTKPQELQGGQSAVMNAKGTLLFIKPSQNLTDDQWQSVFNALTPLP